MKGSPCFIEFCVNWKFKGSPRKGVLFKKKEAYTQVEYDGIIVDRDQHQAIVLFYFSGRQLGDLEEQETKYCGNISGVRFWGISSTFVWVAPDEIILDDLKFENPIKFYSDNKSAINITPNPIQHDKTKHIEIWVIFHQGQFGKTCLYVLSSILSDFHS